MWELTQISIDLVCSSEFLIQVCRKWPVILTAAVKQSAKVLGPLVHSSDHVGLCTKIATQKYISYVLTVIKRTHFLATVPLRLICGVLHLHIIQELVQLSVAFKMVCNNMNWWTQMNHITSYNEHLLPPNRVSHPVHIDCKRCYKPDRFLLKLSTPKR